MRNLVTLTVVAFIPIAASAHPDHAARADVGPVHYVTDPFHIASGGLTITAVLLIVAVWRIHRGSLAKSSG